MMSERCELKWSYLLHMKFPYNLSFGLDLNFRDKYEVLQKFPIRYGIFKSVHNIKLMRFPMDEGILEVFPGKTMRFSRSSRDKMKIFIHRNIILASRGSPQIPDILFYGRKSDRMNIYNCEFDINYTSRDQTVRRYNLTIHVIQW
jgi:hypothetical protein